MDFNRGGHAKQAEQNEGGSLYRHAVRFQWIRRFGRVGSKHGDFPRRGKSPPMLLPHSPALFLDFDHFTGRNHARSVVARVLPQPARTAAHFNGRRVCSVTRQVLIKHRGSTFPFLLSPRFHYEPAGKPLLSARAGKTRPLPRRRGWGRDINEIEAGRGRVDSRIFRSVVLAKA